MKKLLATTAVLLGTASVAVAGNVAPPPVDPAPYVPPAPAMTDWSGFYLGLSGGWGSGDYQPNPNANPLPAAYSFDGLAYGGFVGYNYQLDSGLVLGGEIAFGMGSMDLDQDGTNTPTPQPTFDAQTVDFKVRVGFAADRALVYAFGGYTTVEGDNFSKPAGWTTIGNFDGDGYIFGGGVDFLVTDNLFVGAEYAYRDVEDSNNDPITWDGSASTISARVGFKF